jgi:hypothetical protein
VAAISFQDLMQPNRHEVRPLKRRKKRGKKLLTFVLFIGILCGVGYYFRNSQPVQRVLGHETATATPLPAMAMVRPTVTSAEYSIILSAVQNGAPNVVTTKVRADYLTGTGETNTESQVGGAFTSAQEIRTPDYLFRPGAAFGTAWTRQPRTQETPTTYDTAQFIPMADEIIDEPLRNALQPTVSKSEKVGDETISTMTYVIDRARVPEVAPAIFARVPWLFDVPNATTLTVTISYDEAGVVRYLDFSVDPPQPGTGIDATWITRYTMRVTSLDSPVAIQIPFDAVDVPAGTP